MSNSLGTMEELFEKFWAAYPRKTAKKTARQRWMRMKMPDDLFFKIMAAIEVHKQTPQWQKDGGAYIPHASTWLNQERYEDELEIKVGVPTNDKYKGL